MSTFVALLFLSLIALQASIWFSRDALIARLNPSEWARWRFLSAAVPPVLLLMLPRLLTLGGLFVPKVEQPRGGVISLSIIAVGYLTAYVIHKRHLKPKREAAIGTSLNYVGGLVGDAHLHAVPWGGSSSRCVYQQYV